MCEIAVIDPRRMGLKETFGLIENMFLKNPDGLGLVATYHHGGRFKNYMYRSEDPLWVNVLEFLSVHAEDAWRITIHARLATAGGVGLDQTHPIQVHCKECDVNMVLHNGVVTNHHINRKRLRGDGHNFKTGVDSEVIAHKVGTIPETLEGWEEPDFIGSLNYIVFGDDKILVRIGSMYALSEDYRMAMHDRDFKPEDSQSSVIMLITPDKVETAEASYSYSGSYYQGTYGERKYQDEGYGGWFVDAADGVWKRFVR